MLRYEDIKDISDGRLYEADDKALIGTNDCKGCSHCCESDMGKSIVLTPYDVYMLTKGTEKSFDDLLVGFYVELSMIDGIVLPNLKMDEGCSFLTNGRCGIHGFRPGICRLFPLGRLYEGDTFKYFLQVNECVVSSRTPVVIRRWLGVEDLEQNTAFINKWHRLLRYERKRVSELREFAGHEVQRIREMSEDDLRVYAGIVGDEERISEPLEVSEETIVGEKSDNIIEDYRRTRCEELESEAEDRVKEVMKACLSTFYMKPYDMEQDFYSQFQERLPGCLRVIRNI